MAEPKLRFKEENGVQFPDWEEKTFNDIADYKKGPFGSALKKKIFVPKSNSTVKVYEQQNAISKDWRLERYFVTDEYFQANLKSFSVFGGDIIVSCAGTIGEVYELPNDAEEGIINQALMRVRIKKSVINSMVFKCVFDKMISSEGIKISNGSALKNIPPFADMKKQPVFLPSLPEQQKISSLFTELDTLIQSAEKELEGYRELKQGMLQKMFPKNGEKVPEIRFPEFTGDWEQRKLGDNIIEYTEKTTENNQYPVLTSSRKGVFFQTDYYDGNQIASADNTGYNIVPYGYFTYRHMSDDEIFHFNINDIAENGIVSTLYPVFTTDENLDSRYLQYQLNYGREFARYAILQKQGGSRTYMYLNKLRNLYLTVPTAIEEQKKISEYFTNLDHLIALQQKELDGYKELKKGLLQQMFC